MDHCPCSNSRVYDECCQPIITNQRPAKTAEELMRARYTAHVKVELDFIYNSTHADVRGDYDVNETRKWAADSDWLGLDVVSSKDGTPDDDTGEVEFVARFRTKEGIRTHHERSEFRRVEDNWYFFQGEMVKAQPLSKAKVGRNEPCPCGSGKKFKKCCG